MRPLCHSRFLAARAVAALTVRLPGAPRAVSPAALATLLVVAPVALPLDAQSPEDRFRIPARDATPPSGDENTIVDSSLFQALRYRMIGPFRGGRVTAVAGHPARPHTFFMGSTGGGVWKSDDAGETWRNVSDGYLHVSPVGAIAVAPSDPDILYVGTGSGAVRGNVTAGDGVYRSDDAGRTWRYLGLPQSEHIARIRIDPGNPDIVYVAALGHIFGPNPERGVYRSRDGGATWRRVLSVSPRTGAIDLAMDPSRPGTLYAALWQAERKPWTMRSGGPESGVWKTTDGGDTWTRLDHNGLPEPPLGKIGLAVSAARPDRVYALVESKADRGLYRSDDGGASFVLVSNDRNLTARPWYYMRAYAHPAQPDVVFVADEGFYRSDDGGRTWTEVEAPHGDHHDLWIDPVHPDIWIQSNDGGANVTLNGGRTWSTQLNQPTGEFYTVVTDDRFPYRVYAPQQDNTTIGLPSRITGGLTDQANWVEAAGCETGPIAVDPRDPNVTYGGCQGQISRHDARTGQTRAIWEYPQEYHGRANAELVLRHQWNSQIRFSPHDPKVLYHTSQYVHRTTDGGQTWERISPDLTRWAEHAGLHREPPGGPVTYDQTGVEIYGTVFAFQESPLEPGLLWAGSDDGRVSLSRNGGESWSDITPPGMELHTTVNQISLSPHAAGRAFVVAHRYRLDDWRPLIWRTDDYGKTWTLLTDGRNGIPEDHPTRTLQEDPAVRGLLYVGTEFGPFVSFDDGAHWQPLRLNLPQTPVTDLLVKDNDLVVATQGRALWILDDLTPLQQIALRRRRGALGRDEAFLFPPRDAYRLRLGISFLAPPTRRPENPPEGAALYYELSAEAAERTRALEEANRTPPARPVTVEIADPEGRLVKRFSTRPAEPGRKPVHGRLEPRAGMNRVVWDLRWPGAHIAPGVNGIRSGRQIRVQPITGYVGGPYAVPGTYRVTLRVGRGRTAFSQTRDLRVRPDPRLHTTPEEYARLVELSLRVRDRISAIQRGVAEFQRAVATLDSLRPKLKRQPDSAALVARARGIESSLVAVADSLYKYGEEGDHAHLHPRLTTEFAHLATMLIGSDDPPTASASQRLAELEVPFERLTGRLRAILDGDYARFVKDLQERGLLPALVP
ncbi:MAG: glycosyl hydrolase [Gemmatimonadota bacterium]